MGRAKFSSACSAQCEIVVTVNKIFMDTNNICLYKFSLEKVFYSLNKNSAEG